MSTSETVKPKIATDLNTIEHFYDLLKGFSVGMLVSKCPDGSLHSRPMKILKADKTEGIWFCTPLDAPKVGEMRGDDQVNISLQSSNQWLSVTGKSEILKDRTKIDELWHAELNAWFPKGKDDPNLSLLRIIPSVGEYWDQSSITSKLTYAFEIAKSYVTEKPASTSTIGEHCKADLSRVVTH